MEKVLFTIILLTTYYLLLTIPANADVSSQPIYGGGQMFASTGPILIDKKVLNPQTNNWVDNLSINDPKYRTESLINFQINLTNTGNTEIKQINVKDVFPQFVNFGSGTGNFDANTKTLSFEVNNLKPSETRAFVLVGKVVSAEQLPVDLGLICMTNQATAITSDNGMSQDNVQFCIQKQVLGTQTITITKGGYQTVPSKGGFPVFPAPTITTTPATGGESLALFLLIPSEVAGWFLKKLAYNDKNNKK